MRILVALAVIALSTPAHAERMCISGPMRAQAINSPENEVAGTGGVIVASGEAMPDWRFKDMNRRVRPEVVIVAPGLAIYHPPPLPGRDVVLLSDDTAMAVRTRAFKIDPPSGPPVVESIKMSALGSERRQVVATLVEGAPTRAVVVIVSRVERDKLVPLAWTQVMRNGPRTIQLWHTPFTCEQTIPTAIEPRVGERVVLTWIDGAGRISEPSKPIVISGASMRK